MTEINRVKFFTTFVKELLKEDILTNVDKLIIIENYAELLSAPFNLGMFVPTTLNGEFIEKPLGFDVNFDSEDDTAEFKQYRDALSRVIFDDFTFHPIQPIFDDSDNDYMVRNASCKLYDWEMNAASLETIIYKNLSFTENGLKLIYRKFVLDALRS